MFGITRLNEEEKAAHILKKRKEVLEAKITKETLLRSESLARSKALNEELHGLGV